MFPKSTEKSFYSSGLDKWKRASRRNLLGDILNVAIGAIGRSVILVMSAVIISASRRSCQPFTIGFECVQVGPQRAKGWVGSESYRRISANKHVACNGCRCCWCHLLCMHCRCSSSFYIFPLILFGGVFADEPILWRFKHYSAKYYTVRGKLSIIYCSVTWRFKYSVSKFSMSKISSLWAK